MSAICDEVTRATRGCVYAQFGARSDSGLHCFYMFIQYYIQIFRIHDAHSYGDDIGVDMNCTYIKS